MSRHKFRRPDISDKPLCPYTIEAVARMLEDEAGKTWATAMKISQRAATAMENDDRKSAEMFDAASITLQEINYHHYRAAERVRDMLANSED